MIASSVVPKIYNYIHINIPTAIGVAPVDGTGRVAPNGCTNVPVDGTGVAPNGCTNVVPIS